VCVFGGVGSAKEFAYSMSGTQMLLGIAFLSEQFTMVLLILIGPSNLTSNVLIVRH
jgi:hypothetical protein